MYRILLLHDIPEGVFRVKDYLELSGFNVVEDSLKEVAKGKREEELPDLFLLISDNPDICYAACEEVRSYTQLPVMVLAEEKEEWNVVHILKTGIDDYMVMPYTQGELNARIRTHIGRYKRLVRPFGYIEVPGLEIDAFSRTVKRDGKEVMLRLKEFDVLLFLAQHPNEAMTKQQIYEAVWKEEATDGFYNSVTVHIKRMGYQFKV